MLRVMMPTTATHLDERLDALGAERVRLELPHGRVCWLDGHGAVVAHAHCVPLYAWSPSSRHLHPARALPGLAPNRLDADRDEPTLREAVGAAAAADFARDRARALRLSEAIAVDTETGRRLFLGVAPLCLGAPEDAALDEADQADQLVSWARSVLSMLVQVLADDEPERARAALHAFYEALDTAILAVYHLPVAEDLAGLRSNLRGWLVQLSLDPIAVAIRIRREELRWTPAADSAPARIGPTAVAAGPGRSAAPDLDGEGLDEDGLDEDDDDELDDFD